MANELSFLLDPEYWRSVRETAPNSLAGLAMRLALITDYIARDGSSNKDARIKNAFVEGTAQESDC